MTDAIVKGLSTFQQVLVWIINLFWLYQFVISITSLIKFKEKPMLTDKKHRFIIALPANNEESVIGNLIKSLKMQDYDKSLFDIYVIADNCTDNTAEVAGSTANTLTPGLSSFNLFPTPDKVPAVPTPDTNASI